MRVAAIVAVLVGAAAAYSQTGTGSLSGRVFDRATGAGIRKAAVNLTWHGQPPASATAISDSSGRFRFDRLPAGRYELVANRNGFVASIYGAQRPGQVGSVVTLAAGERKTGVDIGVVRLGRVSGTVRDPDGDPIAGAEVVLMRETYQRGKLTLGQRNATRTDDRGEYRLPVHEAGQYRIAAHLQFRHGGVSYSEGGQEVYPLRYYPGVENWTESTPLDLAWGRQVSGIDFELSPRRMQPLLGRVTGVPESSTPAQVSIFALPVHGGEQEGIYSTGSGPPEYRFQLPHIAAGSYRVVADVTIGGKRFRGYTIVEAGADSAEAAIALAPAVDIRGRVTLEGAQGPLPQWTVSLIPGDGMRHEPLTAQTDQEGRYTVSQVPAGVWDIAVEPIPPGGFIKAMILGAEDVLTRDMTIHPGTTEPLNIVLSTRGGRVKGEVAGKRRAVIVFAPWGKFRHVESYYFVRPSDENGRFELSGITPGAYRLFAFEEFGDSSWMRPGFLDGFEPQSVPLHVSEGANLVAAPQLIEAASPKRGAQ